MIRLWWLGTLLLILILAALSLHTPGALTVGSMVAKTWVVVILGLSAGVFLLAVGLILRKPRSPRSLWMVLLFAAAMRIPLIFSPPFLSTDVFRYVWDGRVQAAGINPYRYIPAAPALTALRDEAIYPHINRADYAPTIYPPAAQVIFATVGLAWSSVTAIKLVMVGFEVLAVLCLLRLLTVAGLPGERILIYAWNPLPIWSFAGNGHIDAATIGLIAAALLLRTRQRDGWAGVVAGAAILTKFLPVFLLPALWRPRGGWRMAATCALVILGLYALYGSVGWKVFGFLGAYGSEEGIDSGSGIWLLAGLSRLSPLPSFAAPLYLATVALLLAALSCWFAFVRRPNDPVAICGASGVLMAVATFAISPHYPWYYAWLAVPCVLAPNRAVLWLSSAPILLYLDTFGDRLIWPSVVFVPALLLALGYLRRPMLALAAEPIKGNT